MIMEVQHETRLEYSEPVTESLTEVRMEPVSGSEQSCRSFHLMVSPLTQLFRYQDGFGNRVHHFNVLAGHIEVRILAASLVETHPRPLELHSCQAAYPLDPEQLDLGALDYLKFRGPVRSTPRLAPLLEILRPQPGQSLAGLVLQVADYIHSHFEYARAVTLSSSPIDDVLEQGKGVCQDFTHLMIAVLRSFGIPARYVSGYLHRPNKESQSHAWCEAWLPDVGWVGIDPTNDLAVNDHFIKVAIGRDFSDIPPNKGVYRGQAEEKISVRVETRALERLPSMAWQDELPPLQVPLMAIASRNLRQTSPAEELSQQQQQQ
ncbi:MAG TPA: transglutaminase family protein [Gemmataceae bacterium]|nr:transglutaminase family protein [Gemmataceae bacterium]